MRSLALGIGAALTLSACGGRPRVSPNPSLPPTFANGIVYHGGRVLTAPKGPGLYYIWYGAWPEDMPRAILTDLAKNLGGSPYFNFITTYHDSSGATVPNVVTFHGSTVDSYSQGMAPASTQIPLIVARALATAFPIDTSAVYVVLTSQDVVPSTFCSRLCGNWGHFEYQGADIKYAWVGNPARCPTRCAPAQPATGPNGNAGVDAMAATLVHEFVNAITNSDRNGWYDSLGRPPASICGTPDLAFPKKYAVSNGALATVRLGRRHYFLTSNWVNARGGSCVLAYP